MSGCMRGAAKASCVAEKAFPETMMFSKPTGSSALQGISISRWGDCSPIRIQSDVLCPLMSLLLNITATTSSKARRTS